MGKTWSFFQYQNLREFGKKSDQAPLMIIQVTCNGIINTVLGDDDDNNIILMISS